LSTFFSSLAGAATFGKVMAGLSPYAPLTVGTVEPVQFSGTTGPVALALVEVVGLLLAAGVDLPEQPATTTAADRARASGMSGRRTSKPRVIVGKGTPHGSPRTAEGTNRSLGVG